MQQHTKCQRYKVPSTNRQERDQMSLELTARVENAASTPVHLQSVGKDVPAATVSLRRERHLPLSPQGKQGTNLAGSPRQSVP